MTTERDPARKTTFNDLLDWRVGGPELSMGVGPSRVVRIATAEQWEEKAEALRVLFRQLLGEIAAPRVELDLEVVSDEAREGYRRRAVRFNVAEGERIRGVLLVPDNVAFPAPGILTPHPTNYVGLDQTIGENEQKPSDRDRAYGLHLVRKGFVTFSYDQLTAGEREYPNLRHFSSEPFYEQFPGWSVRGKDIEDAKAAVDCLLSFPEVDPERIGSIGHSQGGGITIDLMVLDPRIKVGVSNCGTMPFRISDNPFGMARDAWWIGMPALRPFFQCGKPAPIDLHEKLATIAPRPFLLTSAINDKSYGVGKDRAFVRRGMQNLARFVRDVYRLTGKPTDFVSRCHERGHSFEEPDRRAAYRFLKRHLGQGRKTD